MMGKLGQMMGLGGGMPMPTPEQIEAHAEADGRQRPARPAAGPPGIPAAPPPGAFNLPPQFPGLGGAGKLPGPRRRLQPVRGEEEVKAPGPLRAEARSVIRPFGHLRPQGGGPHEIGDIATARQPELEFHERKTECP